MVKNKIDLLGFANGGVFNAVPLFPVPSCSPVDIVGGTLRCRRKLFEPS